MLATKLPPNQCGFWGRFFRGKLFYLQLLGKEKKPINIKEFWRDAPWCASRSVPGTRPICPVTVSRLSRGHSAPFSIDLHINQAQMSHVSLGRPEFVPGTPPGHPDRQIPLCDFSLSVFLSIVAAFLLTVKLLCLQFLKALIRRTFPL